jgi:hypothetical protein
VSADDSTFQPTTFETALSERAVAKGRGKK